MRRIHTFTKKNSSNGKEDPSTLSYSIELQSLKGDEAIYAFCGVTALSDKGVASEDESLNRIPVEING